jgi:hypothetical protein
MSKTDSEALVKTPAPVWRVRLLALGITLAATLLASGVARIAGVDLGVAQPGQEETQIGPVNVAASVVIFGGLGWLARAILDRFARRRAALIWRIGAIAAFVLECFPVMMVEADTGTKVFLIVLHVIVAGILIPVLGKRLPDVEA